MINDNDYKNNLLISKEREIFKDIYNKKLDKIEELNNKIDYNNLKYVVERNNNEYSFNKINDPMSLLNNIKYGKISLEEAKEKQKDYYNYLNRIRKGNKSANQKRTLANINFFLMQVIMQLNLLKIMVQRFLKQKD